MSAWKYMEQTPQVGDRVRLVEEADLYQHGVVPAGTEGTVVQLAGGDPHKRSEVLLDSVMSSLGRWDNRIIVSDHPENGPTWDWFEMAVPAEVR